MFVGSCMRGLAVLVAVIPALSRAVPAAKCASVPAVVHEVDLHASAINDRGERGEGTTHWRFEVERVDLDGDGVPDALVPVPPNANACPEDMSWRVLVVRGGCAIDYGIVGPGTLAIDPHAKPDASGFVPIDLDAESTRGGGRIPAMRTTHSRFVVKRGRYVLDKRTSNTGICHHCARWWCRAAPTKP